MKRIVINAEAPSEFAVDLVGVEYIAKAPKSALALQLMQNAENAEKDPAQAAEIMDTYTLMMFGKKQAAAIRKRLNDPDDLLDLPHVLELVQKISEAATGDPTS